MTRRHLRLREPGWRYGIAVNGTGVLVTFLVLLDIIGTKFTGGAWIVLLTLPLLVLLLDRTNRAYAREREELKVEAPELLAPAKPRHEVLVLVDGLDRAVLHALQYARQLNPLLITALHVAADPGAADRLTRVWAELPLAVPLEVVHCPNRDLVDCAIDAVGDRVRPDTEVTVLLPRHGDRGRFGRLLHDQTERDLLAALNRLAGVNVAVVHPPPRRPSSGPPEPPLTTPRDGTVAAAVIESGAGRLPP
jgi:hypothetical protein